MQKVIKQHPFLLISLLLFLPMIAQKAKSLDSEPAALDGCNATRIGDCLVDEEFSMESETSRRFLASGGKSISPGALNPTKPFCNRNVYGSCIKGPNKFYNKRPCNYANACARDG
ncbi:hypothetical protein CDL12_25538 [Handroanthus impetiginosus]|uniref:Rapid ALkalinization Factor n=1 Tax=Handroanthus impetiginosus TaxID=429701 RepID=A0A2G9G9I6_9LAMI|nr:hypothetical protein CDL12_25538 [Handroanthus impetiginosus]